MSFRLGLVGRFHAFWLIGALVIIFAPQAARGQPRFPEGLHWQMVPQFVATTVRFKAIDESEYDVFGSDEIYVVFSDLNPTLNDRVTSTYGDVDTGETRSFYARDFCIAPQPSCDHGVSEILHFQFSFWESDGGSCSGDSPGLHNFLRNGRCSWDDLIGGREILMSREQLLAVLPRAGGSVDYTVHLGGPCGNFEGVCAAGWPAPTGPEYEITYRITRIRDARVPIIIASDTEPGPTARKR